MKIAINNSTTKQQKIFPEGKLQVEKQDKEIEEKKIETRKRSREKDKRETTFNIFNVYRYEPTCVIDFNSSHKNFLSNS
jgi:hypothetical protein